MSSDSRVAIQVESRGNARLFVTYCMPERPVAGVFLCHGIGEHCGRYQRFVGQLEQARIASIRFDLRGHGQSSGVRGHVDQFADYVADLTSTIDHFAQHLADTPQFLFGHSMGALVALQYLLTCREPTAVKGLLLSSPGLVSTVPVPRYKTLISSALLPLLPRLRFRTGIRPQHLSADPRIHAALRDDPHMYSKVSLRWYAEYQRAAADCLIRANELRLPLYVCVGAADPIVSPEGARRLVDAASHGDKTLCVHPGLLHEPLNEPAGESVGAAMVKWILAHSAAA